ncbi:MAG: GntR family transcriptional regulator [Treponema sp.]|nr:GntR family transcriptional regulator [Treponema sp.]
MPALIKKDNLRDQVYEYIRDGILSQEFKRGDNINLDELSRKLGVSNTPIRESINLLVKEGLIEYKQNNGFFVISPDRETVNEILQVVFFIVVAALRFCFRSGKMNLVLPKMEERLENQRQLLEKGDSLGYIETTYLFERSIVEGVGNKVLVSEYDGKQTILGFIATYYSDNNLEELRKVFAQHEEIFNLLKENKLEDAILKMREHYYKKNIN